MLQNLYVRNIALIDEVSIDFSDQLNILTGETGAGKSILIGSINIALGHRSSKDLVRKGEDKGMVELVFHLEDQLITKVEELGIQVDEDALVVINRTIYSKGRSQSRVNGQTVNNSLLRHLASLLIDIHGQHEHQSLLDEQKHIDLLDLFCKEELQPINKVYDEKLKAYYDIEKRYKSLCVSNEEKERRISMLEHEIKEIEDAHLRTGEEDELLAKRKKLMYSKRLFEGANEVYHNMSGGMDSPDVLSMVQSGVNTLRELVQYDESLQSVLDNLNNASIWLEDVSREVRDYVDHMEHDDHDLFDIEMRLDTINKMKRKYGNSVEKVLEYYEKASLELKQMLDIEEQRRTIKLALDVEKKAIEKLCEKIHKVRLNTSEMLTAKIEEQLSTLQFNYTKFVIDVRKRQSFNEKGMDDVQFLISTNIGEDVKPLSHVASGGEMSRIMLALKTVLAEIDEIPTLIFDEIDAGISGRTAQKVAEKLNRITGYRQVLCITHLPQIAAMADTHLLIEKSSDHMKTTTNVREIVNKEVLNEMARLLSGASVTKTTLDNAHEIIEQANKIKKVNK